MPPFGVAITKQVTWRGKKERFSNVYHYDVDSTILTDSGWSELIDDIVATEKPIFSGEVDFVQGRVWGPTNQGAAASITRMIKDLTGAGTLATGGSYAPELCVVAQFYLGRNPATQRKRFLRKFYHTRRIATSATSSGQTWGMDPLQAGDKTPIINAMNALKVLSIGAAQAEICAPNGDHLPLGTSATVLDYLHTRQFR